VISSGADELQLLALLAHPRGDTMATITVRGLDEDVQRRLKQRAAANNRSMEAEARAILSEAVDEQEFGAAWVEMSARLRGEDIPLPARSGPRGLDLS
jgi:antitoxin FitA